MNSKRKQSLVAGGLVSSTGLLVSKIIGLLYSTPFYLMIDRSTKIYYNQGFSIYSYILNVASAGIPLAVAMLVARYVSANDYKAALQVKRLSQNLMIVIGMVAFVAMMVLSTPIANMISKDGDNPLYYRNVIMILSFALLIVPLLSSIRGFFLGMKEMQIPSSSQAIEQLVRVVFLLATTALIIYVLKFDSIYAVYVAVLASSVAAIAGFLYVRHKGRNIVKDVELQAKMQTKTSPLSDKQMIREIFLIASPYLLVAVFGYSDTLINTLVMPKAFETFAKSVDATSAIAGFAPGKFNINIIIDLVTGEGLKLMSIPQILASGFSAAIIPYITTALYQKNEKLVRKYVLDCFSSVFYIAIPICVCLFAFARPIFKMLFLQNTEYDPVAQHVIQWLSIEVFTFVIAPVCTSLMMALREFRLAVRNLMISAIIKLASVSILVAHFGLAGLVLSSYLSLGFVIIATIYFLHKKHGFSYRKLGIRVLFMVIGASSIFVVSFVFNALGIHYIDGKGIGFLKNFIVTAIQGVLALSLYYGLTAYFGLPQAILNLDLKKIIGKFRRANR